MNPNAVMFLTKIDKAGNAYRFGVPVKRIEMIEEIKAGLAPPDAHGDALVALVVKEYQGYIFVKESFDTIFRMLRDA